MGVPDQRAAFLHVGTQEPGSAHLVPPLDPSSCSQASGKNTDGDRRWGCQLEQQQQQKYRMTS